MLFKNYVKILIKIKRYKKILPPDKRLTFDMTYILNKNLFKMQFVKEYDISNHIQMLLSFIPYIEIMQQIVQNKLSAAAYVEFLVLFCTFERVAPSMDNFGTTLLKLISKTFDQEKYFPQNTLFCICSFIFNGFFKHAKDFWPTLQFQKL